jgi:non-specific serine/threonine protein kinase
VQLSSFVGRENDIAFARKLLQDTRLLTLTGSGGCGKTRLALRVAAEVSDQFAGGVWWVALASLSDGELIPSALARAMGIRVPADRRPLDVVLGHLADQTALLGLDNCEHMVGAVADFIDGRLRASPRTKVLATSREPMVIEGEVTWRVPSLAFPPEIKREPSALGQYDAVRLFIERAVQVRPNFAVTNENAPAVTEICSRLDGIPLALELAAARTRMLTPEKIAAQLDDRFRLLAGGARTAMPRQQTLLASIDWSHDLLEADERALFRSLGVFAGGFTLDAAEAVAPGVEVDRYDVLDVLAQLVNKSLVPETGTDERYRLLETIRHYAHDRLEEAGEGPATRDRHLAWAIGLAEALEKSATNAHRGALDQLEIEHPNFRAALEWGTAAGHIAEVLRTVAALGFFWTQRGHYDEAQRWMTLVDELEPATAAVLLARAHSVVAYVALHGGDPIRARRTAAAALTEAREQGDRETEARCSLRRQKVSRQSVST